MLLYAVCNVFRIFHTIKIWINILLVLGNNLYYVVASGRNEMVKLLQNKAF